MLPSNLISVKYDITKMATTDIEHVGCTSLSSTFIEHIFLLLEIKQALPKVTIVSASLFTPNSQVSFIIVELSYNHATGTNITD